MAAAEQVKRFYDCFLCQSAFQFGPHRYDGRGIGAWGIRVCETCYSSNADGLVLEQHARLAQHLRARGVKVRRNARGWVCWPCGAALPDREAT